MNKKATGTLLDIDYEYGKKSIIRLFFSTKKGKLIVRDSSFKPYFYVIVKGEPEKAVEKIRETELNETKPARIEIVERKTKPEKEAKKVLKLVFDSTKEVKDYREKVRELPFVLQKREFDIPYAKRYLIDSNLEPLSEFEIELSEEKKELKSINKKSNKTPNLKIGAFDLETYCKKRFSDSAKDEIITASYVDESEKVVYSTKKISHKNAVKVENEKELIEKLVEKINQKDLDIICTYNGDSFDFPYLRERGKKLGVKVKIGADGSEPKFMRKGIESAARVTGRQHLDVYQMVRILSRFGIVNLLKMDLESVNKTLFGEEKEKLSAEEMVELWDNEKNLERIAQYNQEDSEATLRIAKEFLPLFLEIAKLVNRTLFDITRSGASRLVEALLMIKSHNKKVLIPNKPSHQKAKQRMMQSFKGGFVREPVPGLHEAIAVLDFASLHPTIMISHNISPDTVNCEHKECKQKNRAPSKHWFCTKRTGFLSSILEELFNKRMELKKKMKKTKKNTPEHNLLDARQHALKILLNSFYGTLGFAHFRWYSRESAMAVTSWSRKYVKGVGKEAEKAGFKTLYGDTDSALIKIPNKKSKEDVKKFVDKINSKLPGVMNLELEGFYKRGIFVTKKTSKKAAKKRYALIDYNDKLEIVGFEYVRRDWAKIAKDTQKNVIKAVLKEGKPDKAIQIVKDTIKKLQGGEVKKENLTIYSQIKKPIKKYESIGPHIAAAKKAIARGKDLGTGSMIGYIVTRSGGSISEKAQLEEFVAEGNYDADYYIKHQVLPAVMKIIRELGYSKEDLIYGGKQSSLEAFG